MSPTHRSAQKGRFKSGVDGFTLVELLVVLAIVGIMSAMVVPRLAGSLGSLIQKTATRKVCAALRFARSQAVSEGTTLIASVDKEKGALIITGKSDSADKGGKPETMDNERLDSQRLLYELPEGVFFESADDSREDWANGVLEILFYPTGRASGGQFFLTRPDKSPFVVRVDRITGAVSIGS